MTRSIEVDEQRRTYLDALLARDIGAARSAIEGALAGGMEVAEIYLEVLQPALYEIGRAWAVGDFSVADEHSATAVTQSVLGMLGPRMRTAPKDGRLAVITGSPEERHALGVQMVADFLEGDGWEVLNLGASTPAPDLARMADAERPDVVAISTATPAGLPGAAESVAALRALDPGPLIVLGGQLWEGRAADAESLGADLVVAGPRELVAVLRERFPPLEPDEEERPF